MAMDFPASPTTGQTFDPGTGIVYAFDGVAWNAVTTSTATARSKNLLINPSMAVSQENGATAVTTSGAYAVDQWQLGVSGPVCSLQQVVGYTPDLSVNRIRKTVTTQKASLAAADYSEFQQAIEGLRISCLGYGSAAAIQSVVRFGFKAPAGTYSLAVTNGAGNRSYVKNFTISAGQANTDTIQTFVVPGDTTGTWPTDNTTGCYFYVFDAVGTTYQGVEGWQAGAKFGTAANSNMVATNGNVVELFDVGLYPDPDKTGLAPKYELPDYGTELDKCCRYWHQVQTAFSCSNTTATGQYYAAAKYTAIPRTTPTFTAINLTNSSFPATVGTFTHIVDGVAENRAASVTGTPGLFRSQITVNARM